MSTETQDFFHTLGSHADILFVRLRSLGDCLLLTAPVRLLKRQFPGFRVAVLVEERFRECFSRNLDFFEVLTTRSGKLASLRKLLRRRFDAIINLHGGPTSTIYTCAARGVRIGVDDFHYPFLYSGLIPHGDSQMHTVEKTMEWFRWMGLDGGGTPALEYAPHAEAADWARETMGPDRYVVINPAASMDTKRWAMDGFTKIGRLLQAEGLRAAVTAGPGVEDLARRVAAAVPGSVLLLDLEIPQLAELIRAADLYLGNDGGPMHLAAAVATPTVAVWGSSSSIRWRPWGVPHRVVQNPFDCNPCPGYRCLVAATPLCIESVTVAQVAEAVASLLAETGQPHLIPVGAADR